MYVMTLKERVMKPTKTLKNILKPPFELSHNDGIYDKEGTKLEIILLGGVEQIGHGRLVRRFICDAMNEKWNRDHGERKRWKPGKYYGMDDGHGNWDNTLLCPDCNTEKPYGDNINFCPHCGVGLDPLGGIKVNERILSLCKNCKDSKESTQKNGGVFQMCPSCRDFAERCDQYRTMRRSIEGKDYKTQLDAINKFRSGG